MPQSFVRFVRTGRPCQLAGTARPCAIELLILCSRIAAYLQAWLPLSSGSEACRKGMSMQICMDGLLLSVRRGGRVLCNRFAFSVQ